MKKARIKKQMTLKEMSRKTKIPMSVLINIERKRKVPLEEEIKLISKVLKISPKKLDFEMDYEMAQKNKTEAEEHLSDLYTAICTIRKNFKRGDNSHIECPVCSKNLYFVIQEYNGHIWGNCETEGCLSWME